MTSDCHDEAPAPRLPGVNSRTESGQAGRPRTLVAASRLGTVAIAVVRGCHAVPRSLVAVLSRLGTVPVAPHARRPIALQHKTQLLSVHACCTACKASATCWLAVCTCGRTAACTWLICDGLRVCGTCLLMQLALALAAASRSIGRSHLGAEAGAGACRALQVVLLALHRGRLRGCPEAPCQCDAW
jgi:hypothetical protein